MRGSPRRMQRHWPPRIARKEVEPGAARALPRPHRPAERPPSTRSSRSTSTGRAPRPTPPTTHAARGDVGRPAARAADHDQGRHRDRRHPLHRRRASSSPTTCRRPTRPRSRGSRTPARSCSARPTCRAGRATCRPTTTSSAPPTTRGTLDRTPGGSSGGARPRPSPPGFTSFELGTDIGGSVRIPSHCCGVFGLKPSFGVIPQRGYLDHVGGGTTDADINVFGPIARSADDLDLLLGVLAGPPEPERAAGVAPRAARAARREVDATSASACGSTTRCRRSTASSSRVLRDAADRLADAGAKVEEAHPPVDFAEQVDLFVRMIIARDLAEHADDERRPRRWRRRIAVAARRRAARAASARCGPSGSSVRRAAVPGDADARLPARPGG